MDYDCREALSLPLRENLCSLQSVWLVTNDRKTEEIKIWNSRVTVIWGSVGLPLLKLYFTFLSTAQ